MSQKFGIKIDEIFNTMEARFRPEGAQGVDASFGYDMKESGKWKLTVKDGKMKVEKVNDLAGCVVIMKADADTFVGAQIGKVDFGEAFTSGKIVIEGDMAALGKTGKMFKKFAPPKKELTTREYVQDMIGTLTKRFNPKGAEGINIKIAYDITGPDGGQWTATIKDGTIALATGLGIMPTLKIIIDDQSYVDWQLGKIDAMGLLSMGKAALEGDALIAMKIPEMFVKYAPPGAQAEQEQELLVLKRVVSVNQRFATGPVVGKFLNGLKEKKILANKCPKCGRLQVPPREACAECRVRTGDDLVEIGPKGNVRYMDIAYFASPDPLTGATRETPYSSTFILLDGCKGNETFTHSVRRDQLNRIQMGWNEKKGTVVRPVWAENRTGGVHDILYFEIDE